MMMKYLLLFIFIGQFFNVLGQKTFEEQVDQIFSDYDLGPGACVGIIEDDNIKYKQCYGNAMLEHDVLMSEHSVLDIGTLAMHFTAACIMKLANEDKLALSDPAQKYLPNIEGDFTLQQMLNHTSGLRDYVAILMLKGQSFQENFNQRKLQELMENQKALVIEPGSEYRFSHSNYLLLASIVEKVSGEKYEYYLEKNFFEPYGMKNTVVYSKNNMLIKDRANAYNLSDGRYVLDQRYNFNGYGDGRIYTTLEDMIKWVTNIMSDKIFKQLTVRGTLNNGEQMTYANGLENGVYNGNVMNAHNGYFGAFSSMFIDFPELSKSIIVMSNSGEHPAPQKAYQVADVLVEFKQEPDVLEDDLSSDEIIKLETSEMSQFAGNYFFRKYGYIREINLIDDTLRYKINDNAIRNLLPIAKDLFTIEGSSEVQFKFTDDAMELIFQNGPTYDYEKFKKSNYSSSDMAAFAGTYHSEELDASIDLSAIDGKLVTYKGEEQNLVFRPVMKNTFTSEHDGYIELSQDGLILVDYSLGAVKFNKVRL